MMTLGRERGLGTPNRSSEKMWVCWLVIPVLQKDRGGGGKGRGKEKPLQNPEGGRRRIDSCGLVNHGKRSLEGGNVWGGGERGGRQKNLPPTRRGGEFSSSVAEVGAVG